jgi:hypothetical protein
VIGQEGRHVRKGLNLVPNLFAELACRPAISAVDQIDDVVIPALQDLAEASEGDLRQQSRLRRPLPECVVRMKGDGPGVGLHDRNFRIRDNNSPHAR